MTDRDEIARRRVYWLLLAAVFLEIVTLPKLPGLRVAPINLVLLAGLAQVAFRMRLLQNLDPAVRNMIALLGLFGLYEYMLALVVGRTMNFPVSSLRTVAELTLCAVACRTTAEVRGLLWSSLMAVSVSTALGLLVYAFGGPFDHIRDWMLQSTDVGLRGVSGRGMWISGLSGTHFLFAYVIGTAPVLAVIGWRLTGRIWWVALLGIFTVALYFNAERAALLAGALGVAGLVVHWRLLSALGFMASLTAALVAAFVMTTTPPKARQIALYGQNIADRLGRSDALDRLEWQYAGLRSVLENPLSGADRRAYEEAHLGRRILVDDPSIDIPYAHNHYINVGMHGGVVAWGLLGLYLLNLLRLARQLLSADSAQPQFRELALGYAAATAAPMLIALFHNSGIFFNEPMTVIATGGLIALWHVHRREREAQP